MTSMECSMGEERHPLIKNLMTQDREYTVFWAEETVLEQSLLLDILFLLYYEPLNSCKAARFKELLSCFQVLFSKMCSFLFL